MMRLNHSASIDHLASTTVVNRLLGKVESVPLEVDQLLDTSRQYSECRGR
jgi:hypothetical protein